MIYKTPSKASRIKRIHGTRVKIFALFPRSYTKGDITYTVWLDYVYCTAEYLGEGQDGEEWRFTYEEYKK